MVDKLGFALLPKRALSLALICSFAGTMAPASAQYGMLFSMGSRAVRHAARHVYNNSSGNYSNSSSSAGTANASGSWSNASSSADNCGGSSAAAGQTLTTSANNDSAETEDTNAAGSSISVGSNVSIGKNVVFSSANGNGGAYGGGTYGGPYPTAGGYGMNHALHIKNDSGTGNRLSRPVNSTATTAPASASGSASGSDSGDDADQGGSNDRFAGGNPGISYPRANANINAETGVYQPNNNIAAPAQQPVSFTPNTFSPNYSPNNYPPAGYTTSENPAPTRYRGRHADRGSINRINQEVRAHNAAVDLYNKAVDQLKKEEYREAIASCNAALQIDANIGEAHHLLAIALNDLQDFDGALAQCRLAIQQNSHDADNYYTAADAARHLRDFDSSYKYYQKFLALGGSGDRAEEARNVVTILDHNYFHQADGDYLTDATREGVQRWPASAMPLKVYIEEGNNVNGYRPAFSGILKEAFKDWENSCPNEVSFVFVDSPDKANIKCAWTSEKTKLGSMEELGLTKRSATTDGQVVAATIDFYSLFDKKGTPEQILHTAKAVDLHEIGHALGLDHSQQVYDIMYYCMAPDGLEFPLSERDKKTMIALYGAGNKNVAVIKDGDDANRITASTFKLRGK